MYQCMAYNTVGAILSRRASLQFACKSVFVTCFGFFLRGNSVEVYQHLENNADVHRTEWAIFAIFIRVLQCRCDGTLSNMGAVLV